MPGPPPLRPTRPLRRHARRLDPAEVQHSQSGEHPELRRHACPLVYKARVKHLVKHLVYNTRSETVCTSMLYHVAQESHNACHSLQARRAPRAAGVYR